MGMCPYRQKAISYAFNRKGLVSMKKLWLCIDAGSRLDDSEILFPLRLVYIIETTDAGIRRCFCQKNPIQKLFTKNISGVTNTDNIEKIMSNYRDQAHQECVNAMKICFIMKRFKNYCKGWKSIDRIELPVNRRNRFSAISTTTFVKGVNIHLIFDGIRSRNTI